MCMEWFRLDEFRLTAHDASFLSLFLLFFLFFLTSISSLLSIQVSQYNDQSCGTVDSWVMQTPYCIICYFLFYFLGLVPIFFPCIVVISFWSTSHPLKNDWCRRRGIVGLEFISHTSLYNFKPSHPCLRFAGEVPLTECVTYAFLKEIGKSILALWTGVNR